MFELFFTNLIAFQMKKRFFKKTEEIKMNGFVRDSGSVFNLKFGADCTS